MLQKLGSGTGSLKAGFLGFAGSGKTYTATQLAIGLRDHLSLEGPIAMFDTEAGSEYIAPIVRAGTGLDLVGIRSRSLADLMVAAKECEVEQVSVLIVDSITHVWREVMASYLSQINESLRRKNRPEKVRLGFEDWSAIKDRWNAWPDYYLNSRLHIIICGRAGFEWEFQESEDARGQTVKELTKVGTKMKVESEFGFEPSLLVEMQRIQQRDDAGKLVPAFVRRATVLKDRFAAMDGAEADNPTFAFFMPHVRMLTPGQHAPVDTALKTDLGVDDRGEDEFQRERRERVILCEKIQAALVERWPGQTAKEKRAKARALAEILGTTSWTEVETRRSSEELRQGLEKLTAAVEEKAS